MPQASQSEVNKVIRVLQGGNVQKYTMRLFRKSGEVIEFQSDVSAYRLIWSEQTRGLMWVGKASGYDNIDLCQAMEGDVMVAELNPGHKEAS